MAPTPVDVPAVKLSTFVVRLQGASRSLDKSVTFYVDSVPVGDVPGPTDTYPACFDRFFLTGEVVGTPVGVTVKTVPMEFDRAEALIIIMPVFTPVVAPVTYIGFVEPMLAGPAAVAIITRRLYVDIIVEGPADATEGQFFIVFSDGYLEHSPTTDSDPSPVDLVPCGDGPEPPTGIEWLMVLGFFPLWGARFSTSLHFSLDLGSLPSSPV